MTAPVPGQTYVSTFGTDLLLSVKGVKRGVVAFEVQRRSADRKTGEFLLVTNQREIKVANWHYVVAGYKLKQT
jgi:hypothetical protein